MIEKFKDYEEIKKAYPKTMSKDQFYKVAHIKETRSFEYPVCLRILLR